MKAGGRNLKTESLPERIHSGEYVFWIALGWLDVWFFGGRHNFSSLSLICAFSLYCFSRSFSRRFPANSMGYFCCGRSGGPKLAFHWSAVCPGWQPLWWGVISFQNFRSLELGLYFCGDFLALSELIGYIDLTDYYEIWPKCSLVINAKKGVRLFWYSKYFSFWALLCAEDRQIFNSPTSK